MIDLRYAGRPLPRLASIGLVLTVILLVLPTAAIALALGIGLLALPYELDLVLRRLPLIFPLHMIAAALALILIPITAFARHRRGMHRALGRLAAAAVVLGGLTALPVALASVAVPVARAGLFVQGIVWLGLLATGIAAIRRGEVARHAGFMLAMAAVASGAIWLRLTTFAALSLGLPFDPVYAVGTWACWLVPLGFVLIATAGPRGARQALPLASRQVA